jgi:cyclic beta-1,2-glucan synthetase
MALLVLALFIAPTFDLIHALTPKSTETTLRGHVAAFVREFVYASAQVALKVILIAHNAWMMGDAIVRTIYRMTVSRKNLLEWRTASQVQKSQPDTLSYYYGLMAGSVVVAAGAFVVAVAGQTTGANLALCYTVLWALAPAIAWYVSRSAEEEDELIVTDGDREKLRRMARRTWLYYETHVTDEHNQLPPDNMQETPYPVVANRTSPTNIGMYLLSVVAARDFGWIALSEAIERSEKTLDSVERLDRERGHLYNWYETKSLRRCCRSTFPASTAAIWPVISWRSRAPAIWAAGAGSAFLQGDLDGIVDAVAHPRRIAHCRTARRPQPDCGRCDAGCRSGSPA